MEINIVNVVTRNGRDGNAGGRYFGGGGGDGRGGRRVSFRPGLRRGELVLTEAEAWKFVSCVPVCVSECERIMM